MYMAGVTPLRTLIALAALAIGMLALATMRWRGKPKQRAEKWEKAEIMKQLLALSEGDARIAAKALPDRATAPTPKRRKRTSPVQVKTPTKTRRLSVSNRGSSL
jgi:hypothetical protein